MPKPSSRLIKQIAYSGLLVALAGSYLVLGSREWATGGSDAEYLRPPAPISAALTPETLFPLKPHARWTLQIQKPTGAMELQTEVMGNYLTRAGKIALTKTSMNKTEFGRRAYLENRLGVALLAIGDGANAYFKPPLPFLLFPLKSGRVHYWRGEIRMGAKRIPAIAAVRVAGPDPITMQSGTFVAYRVDLLLLTGTAPQTNRQLTTLWISPNFGIVREQNGDIKSPTITELVRYSAS